MKKNYLKIYDQMIDEYLKNRKVLKERFKAVKGESSIFTIRFYEREINICNRYIKALKNAKKNQKAIDTFYSIV